MAKMWSSWRIIRSTWETSNHRKAVYYKAIRDIRGSRDKSAQVNSKKDFLVVILSLHTRLKNQLESSEIIHKKVGPILIADELMSEWVNESMSGTFGGVL
jgi:hypothetical protein